MRAMRLQAVVVLSVCMWLSGCAGVAPSSLKPVKDSKSIELPQNVRWKYDSGLDFGYWEYLLLAGSYKATVEDSAGTFYVGPKPSCLFQTVISESKPPFGNSLECAIYVPHKPTESARVFMINNGIFPQTEFNADKTPVTDRARYRKDASQSDVSGSAANIASTTAPKAGPAVSGLGAGIGAGIVEAMAEAERGRFVQFSKQPPTGWLEKAMAAQ